MRLVGRYIFRQVTVAFLITLVSLTATVWITQALARFDLITAQGQTVGIFLFMTSLLLPTFIAVLAPVALFLATIHTLNRLNADSELAVLNAAGVSRWTIVAPFLLLGVLVTIGVAVTANKITPDSLALLRKMITEVRTDVFTNIIQPGRFSAPEDGLTVHIRDRDPDGTLRGLLVQDDRKSDQQHTYLAERGHIAKSGENTYLVMRDGTIQRRFSSPQETQIVSFDSYAIDLLMLGTKEQNSYYEPRERPTSYLLNPDKDDILLEHAPGRFRTELHERLSSPLYPIAFVFIGLAALGFARTTRQGRGLALVTAGAVALIVRLGGISASSLAAKSAGAVLLVYLIPLACIAVCAALAFGVLRIDLARSAVANWVLFQLEKAERLFMRWFRPATG